ncbi:hypothetical protein Droror1_Dr00008949 [Drosera rotundifolia]
MITGTPSAAAAAPANTSFSDIDVDVIRADILSRLDGPDLVALGCVSAELHRLATRHDLWESIIESAWPSTRHHPDFLGLIKSFPNGPSSFFSQSFPLLNPATATTAAQDQDRRSEDVVGPSSGLERVVSAVDVSYRGKNIFSTVHGTETGTGWFRGSPFRIDLLEPRDIVPTPIRKNAGGDEETCRDLFGEMTLSWVLIDPTQHRAVNLSSFRPVAVQRRWWSGEVVVRFASILPTHVMCCIEVTCAGAGGDEGGQGEDEELHVREVSMRVEDIDGAHLRGEHSLVILETAFGGKRVNRDGKEGETVKSKYEEFMDKRRERKERRLKREGRLDLLCISFAVSVFVAFFMVLIFGR